MRPELVYVFVVIHLIDDGLESVRSVLLVKEDPEKQRLLLVLQLNQFEFQAFNHTDSLSVFRPEQPLQFSFSISLAFPLHLF